MGWLGYVKKSKYNEVLERCRELEEKVKMITEELTDLKNENTKIKERLEKIVSKPQYDLQKVRGLGAKRAEKLKAAGIENVMDLAEVSVETIVNAMLISEKFAFKLIEEAKTIIEKN